MRLRNGVLGVVLVTACGLGSAATATAATDTVTNLHDSGLGSLRAVIAAASSGDTVVFESGLTGTITLTGGAVAVDKNLTIVGPGAGLLKVDAGDASRIFETAGSFSSISVSISGLTLADGAATNLGGAICFEPVVTGEASLVVMGSTFADDRAGGEGTSIARSGQGSGGAIAFETNGRLTIANSTFAGDRAGGNGGEGASSAQGDGGAIAAFGDDAVSVTGSSFSEDRAGGNGGIGESSAQGDGGAIDFSGEGVGDTLTIGESSFSGNSAGGNGGAGTSSAQADGGAISAEDTTLMVSASTFNGNQAGGIAGAGPAGGEAYGGAIALFGTGATLTNDTIEANSAGGPIGAGSGGGGVAGGGLWSGAPATLLNDTIDGNAVIGAGGAGGNIDGSAPGPVTLKNTIVAAGAAAIRPNCASNVISAGHNLESTTPSECGLTPALGDLIGVNPLLGPLQFNGGPTETQALLEGSPAIEAGENAGCPATDQRGVTRPQPAGGRCDIGAFEFVPPTSGPPKSEQQQPPTDTTNSPTGTTNSPTGIATTAKGVEELLLGCSKRELVLDDVLIRGGRVYLNGSAAKSLDGKKVKLIFDSSKQVATATVGAHGEFSATAPLPPASIRVSNSARYMAESGRQRSLNLKLNRRLELANPTFSVGSVTLTGQVVPPLAKPIATITVEQQLECGRTTRVLTFKPAANGSFHVRIKVPAAAKAGIYRLTSTVRESTRSRRGFATYSLPLPVVLG